MRFLSTRNPEREVSLAEAISAGLAPDGGLYVPQALPRCPPPATTSLAEAATELLAPYFAEDALAAELASIAHEALNFPAPLTPLGDSTTEVLELFHGPTAAFKDFGARFLAASMARLEHGARRRLTILVATSGDTGGAVAAAFHHRPEAEVLVLYPKGLVSPRQEQQLTCWDDNVRSLAVRGTFDDCQRLVKGAMQDAALAQSHRFSSANSINIGRLLPQMVYYAVASQRVFERTGGKASFVVPSGNLGNALACLWAREMGMPIGAVVLAHNANRTVPDFLASGEWRPRASIATLASAMDVGNPSNFERMMHSWPGAERLREQVTACSVSDGQIRSRIAHDFHEHGRIWCPHSAAAAEALAQLPREQTQRRHWVLVATAHPAKFAEIIEPLIGRQVPVPPALAALFGRERRVTEIDATAAALAGVLRNPCSSH
jgi:threonine synthase